MSDLDPPNAPASASTDTKERQSPLSEAVEQAADTANRWFDDLAGLAKHQANRVSAGDYGLGDLVNGQFDLLRIWVKNATTAAMTLTNNLALLSSPPVRSGAVDPVRTRELKMSVNVPPKWNGDFAASDLVGRRHGFRVPGSKIIVQAPAEVEEAADPARVLTVTIDFGGAPNGIYDGSIRSTDKTVSARFMVPLGEFGEPGSESVILGP